MLLIDDSFFSQTWDCKWYLPDIDISSGDHQITTRYDIAPPHHHQDAGITFSNLLSNPTLKLFRLIKGLLVILKENMQQKQLISIFETRHKRKNNFIKVIPFTFGHLWLWSRFLDWKARNYVNQRRVWNWIDCSSSLIER